MDLWCLLTYSVVYTTIKIVRLSMTAGDRGKRSVIGGAGRSCWAWSTQASLSSSQQSLSGRGARIYTCTCVHDIIPCRRLPKLADRRIPTLPGPEGPEYRGWLGLMMASGDMWPVVAPF